MKKFAFLLAIVAIFAMSAAAFADNNITAIATGTATDINNGAVVASGDSKIEASTNLYYFGTPAANAKIGASISVEKKGTSGASNALGAMAPYNATYATGTATVANGATGIWDENTDAELKAATITLTAAHHATDPALVTVGVIDDTPEWVASTAKALLKVVPTAIDLSGDITVTSLKDSTKTINISGDLLPEGLVMKDLKVEVVSKDATSEASDTVLDGTAKTISGLKVAYDATKFALTVSNDTAPAGTKLVLAIKATANDALVISDDAADGVAAITVAGVADNAYLGYITITVEKSEIEKLSDAIVAQSADLKVGLNVVSFINGLPGATGTKVVINSADAIEVVSTDSFIFAVVSADKDHNIEGYEIADGATPRIMLADGLTHDANEASADLGADRDYDPETGIVTFSVNGYDIQSAVDDIYDIVRAATVDRDVHMDFRGFPAAIDPIAITFASTEPDYSSSSSGACDMGFGLVAVAGLAALALRKRSK